MSDQGGVNILGSDASGVHDPHKPLADLCKEEEKAHPIFS